MSKASRPPIRTPAEQPSANGLPEVRADKRPRLRHPHVIHPTAVYSLDAARQALGLAKGTLPREVRLGRLRVSKRGGRYFLLGSWLLEWLESGEVRKGLCRCPATVEAAAEK